MASSSSVRVAVRVRPLNKREKDLNSNVVVRMVGNQTTLESTKHYNVESNLAQERNKAKHKSFVYDYSYWSAEKNDHHYTSQEQVFKDLGTHVLDAAFDGYNACVFAYGQTGAGKTYTMMGEKHDPGLIPRICQGLYGHIGNNSNEKESFKVEVSYLEIYNEHVLDLLRPPSRVKREILPAGLRVREHPKEGPFVEGLSKHDAPDYAAVESFMNQGNHLRSTAATKMNDQSSRSHAIFTIKFTQAKFVAGLPSEITSKINLVDLAGSERVAKSGATGERLKEGGNINKSLTTLGLVISTLAERSCQSDLGQRKLFIPYRDSVLTWLLKDSLGGNSKTIMIAAISPSDSCYGETLSTLRYADRAKNIINAPTVNEDPNVKLIRELKTEIERLKAIIAGGQNQIRDSLSIEDVDEAEKLLKGTENKMEKHLREWADKWRDTLLIIEESDIGLHKDRSTLRIDMDPPHLVLLDDDLLNTSITIFSLKEGNNFIGSVNSHEEKDVVFDKDDIKNEHCVMTYADSKVTLTPKDGYCQINRTAVDRTTRLSQGDVISLGQDVRLKFNFPQEASLLREKRRSEFLSTGSVDKCLNLTSSPIKIEEIGSNEQLLSPVTDESGVEVDMTEVSEENECDKTKVDELKHQVEDLLTKYKQSEIERFEAEAKNKSALEEKEKEIKNQAKRLLALQKDDEALLQQHQKELQELREKLAEEKHYVRSELRDQIEKLFSTVSSTNKDLVDGSKKDLEKYKRTLAKQLKREWSMLDQYEMKLIEVEAEKRKTLNEAEKRLKKERRRSKRDKKQRLEEIEKKRKRLQEELEHHLQHREASKQDYEEKQQQSESCRQKLEEGMNSFLSQLRELEWMQYRLCTDQLESDQEDDGAEMVQNVKALTKDVQALESEYEKKKDTLAVAEASLCEKADVLAACEGKVEEITSEMAELRNNLLNCQQRFGEELGDALNAVTIERDADLQKIESDKEALMSSHLEHQRTLEVLVNESLVKVADDEKQKVKEIKQRVLLLIRSASPALEKNSLQSQIIEKKVLIHHRQIGLGKKEEKRRKLHDLEEDKFLAVSEEAQREREIEQKELQEKIKALQLLVEQKGPETEVSADYFESESSTLMRAQRHILDLDRKLAGKIRERREIEEQLENVKRQIELQAESSQEQFRTWLDELQARVKEKEKEIAEMRKELQVEADQYLTKLRRENFVVLEKPIKPSSYTKVGTEAVDDLLKEIALASHVPELAESYNSITQDCGGWRYEEKEKEVDLLRKENTEDGVHSFLGRGVIRAPPGTVFQAVSNPLSRFVYDRMLKNIRIVESLSQDLRIVYMLHETTHCFIKHSRDFCMASMDREKNGKLVTASQSVEHPSCPEVKGVVRAKILSSGWVVEPITIHGQPCSLVWYLIRVFLGKSVPSKLINLVSKRQPLSIAYLREYLVT